jgi:two-component system cell cycle sensor histidine kinase PleC
MRHAVGEYVWLRMRAVLTNDRRQNGATLLGFVMDVTTERAVEQESHRADLRLRDAIESISEAFVLWDEHNQLVMCNTKYQSFHGLPTELVQRGTAYRDLMAVARAPQMEIEIPHGLDEETGERSYEAQFQDGRWLQISERHTRHGGFVSVGTDITSRKAQEEQLLENERRLRLTVNDLGVSREALRKQASQLSELADRYLEQKAEAISASRMKAEFLANMNHEMRTPLNAIIGFSEALQQQVWGPIGSERYLGYVNDIHASGARLLVLVNDILDMANIEAGRVSIKREAHSIGDLLAASVRRVIPDAEAKAVSLSIDPDEGSPAGARELLIDPEAMMQALTHLLRNSIRLSPTGGQVSMRARLQGEGMNIFIADAGCTLTATEIGALNDPFGHIDGMLHNGCKGSGLGFPIAKALIELHGGTLKMRSSPRYGSLVMVHLPIAPEPQQLSLPIA